MTFINFTLDTSHPTSSTAVPGMEVTSSTFIPMVCETPLIPVEDGSCVPPSFFCTEQEYWSDIQDDCLPYAVICHDIITPDNQCVGQLPTPVVDFPYCWVIDFATNQCISTTVVAEIGTPPELPVTGTGTIVGGSLIASLAIIIGVSCRKLAA